MTSKKFIGVYETEEYGAVLFRQNLEASLARQKLDHAYSVIPVLPKEICDPQLFDRVVGLGFPGRNNGQDYRNEWGADGSKNIKDAFEAGLSILAVCAGSAVLTRQVYWNNSYENSPLYQNNEHALLDGNAVGPIEDLWRAGYRSEITVPDVCFPNKLSVAVTPVAFDQIANLSHGNAVYWGGCAFRLTDKQKKQQQIEILATHELSVSVPTAFDFSKNPNTISDPLCMFKPAAVLEFRRGLGTAIFSNIHMEIDATHFGQFFCCTPQATTNPARFSADQQKLAASQPLFDGLFDRFVQHCTKINSPYCS